MKKSITLLLTLAFFSCQKQAPTSSVPTLNRIAIGSCSHEYDDDQMWNQVSEQDPDLYVWLGDIIYGDSEDMSVLQAKYDQQKSRESYQKMIAKVPVTGIWDDHDFGKNDGGKGWKMKDESKKLLFNFLEISDTAAVRDRAGIYRSQVFGPEGKQVKLILLDTRYFRDKQVKDPDPARKYMATEGSILGEDQWNWLKDELSSSTAQIHIIASGIQILPQDHGYEKWDNFPAERTKLIDLITVLNVKKPLLISGDRHISEVSRLDVDGLNDPIVEFTSSGLTHSYEESTELNMLREGPLVTAKSFGIIDINWTAEPIIELSAIGKQDTVFFNYQF